MTMPATLAAARIPVAMRWLRSQPGEAITVAYAITYLVLLFVAGSAGGPLSVIVNVAYFVIGALTMREQVRVARRAVDRRTRFAWSFLAASSGAIWITGAAWTAWLAAHPGAPDPRWSDVLAWFYIPFAALGFALFPAGSRFTLRDRGARMDALLLTLGGIALSWHFSLRPLLSQEPGAPALWTIATVLSEWLVAVLASIAYLRAANPTMRRAIAVALGAHLSYILSDFFWVSSRPTYLPGHWLDALWFCSWMLRWASARQAARVDHGTTPDETTYKAGLAPVFFVAGAYSLLLLAVNVEGQHASLDIAVAAGAMTVLLLVRQGMSLADNRRLDRETAAIAARYRSIVSHATDFVMVIDDRQQLTFVSPTVENVLGIANGAALATVVHADDQKRIAAWLVCPSAAPVGTSPRCRLRTAAGAWIDVELRAQDRRRDPALNGIVINARDISAEVALEDQLGHARKLGTLSDMAGRIAHAFNNTLAVLQGHAELLAHQLPVSGATRDDVAALQSAAERAAGITRQLLGFSGGNAARPELVHPQRIVNGLLPSLRRLLPDSVQLHVDQGDTRLGVVVDRAQFEQVLVNLVANARDAMPCGGGLFISVRAGDSADGQRPRVLIAVRDTGGGIPDRIRTRIFEPFFTTKAPGRGTGLGLAMVESIVRRAGGRIDVETGPRRGTEFTISLPRVDDTTPARSHAPVEPVGRAAAGAILLVDDEPGVRRAMRRMLESEGHVVIEAADGAAALDIMEVDSSRIDLLVTDLMMPGVSGRELIARFRERHAGVPIICMTGFAPEREMSSPFGPEVRTILAKPFTFDALKRAVISALTDDEGSRTQAPVGRTVA